MAAPLRGKTGDGPYFITTSTFQKRSLLHSDRMKQLLIDIFFQYRDQQKYLLHEFVIMNDHVHLLISPLVTLERAMQFIKAAFHIGRRKGWDLCARFGSQAITIEE